MAKNKKPWAEHWDCCQKCGGADSSHAALGLCRNCYMELLRLALKTGRSEELEEWRRKNKTGHKKVEGWSREYECCVVCGKTDSRHTGKGLCVRCYNRIWYREHKGKWSRGYERCIVCGRNDIPHKAFGLCVRCYQAGYGGQNKDAALVIGVKTIRKLRPCGICGKKVWMVPGQAFCKTCRNSDLVRFASRQIM